MPEDVPAASASETVVVLALLRDVEGRGLLVVEGAESQIPAARTVEPHAVADDLQDIQPFLDPSDVVVLHGVSDPSNSTKFNETKKGGSVNPP